MPNNGQNIFELRGNAEDISSLREFILKKDENGLLTFDFNSVFPIPKEFPISEDGRLPSNAWCDDHWGVKWNSYDCHIIEDSSDMFIIEFFTAGSPPVGIYDRLKELFPNLDMCAYWFDEGSCECIRVM